MVVEEKRLGGIDRVWFCPQVKVQYPECKPKKKKAIGKYFTTTPAPIRCISIVHDLDVSLPQRLGPKRKDQKKKERKKKTRNSVSSYAPLYTLPRAAF